jgi:3-oxoadipate enol-lactonase
MRFTLDNGNLAYEKTGNGIPFLFIHGYPLSGKIWQPQRSDLSDIATLISIDLRGHGESYPFDPPYPMERLADDCKQLLNSINVKPPIVVCGLSMGGYVTMALYRKYPQIFAGMILTSTRCGADSPEGKANRDAAVKKVRERGVPYIVKDMLPKLVSPITLTTNPLLMSAIRAIMLETSVNGVVGALQGMRDRPDSTSLLSQISFPVLIVHGADDQLIPLREAEAMQRRIPGSRIVVIPVAGHLANMEQSEKFNQAVRSFILSLA